ncbi:MAG: sigma-70 family RNA polymerase sigma factor [Anaerolineae bacterium]|nr:sigma-70 family RNA polymerase sigma factor [Anaerolineae bacterium]
MKNVVIPTDGRLTELIDQARAGDQSACAAIYHRFVQSIYRLAYGVLLDSQDAEEVVQDTFTYALRNLQRFDEKRSAFKTWLYTIAMCRCRNKRRRKWLPIITLSDIIEWPASPEPLPETIAEAHHTREVIWSALRELSPKLREAIVLRYFDGLSYREMADVLGCPQKTAESRVRLAHEALYGILSGQRDVLLEGVFEHE